MQYRREIDGLRAVAILFIMLFHSNLNYLNGGYIGVDIFFVISGYLISSKIINDIKSNQFSIFDFWERRARRILPALFFVLAFSTLIACFVFFPSDLMNFSASLISVITLTSNIYFSKTTGYFQTTSDLIPLIHTWSLAVEEHFYLFFPILLVLWVKRNKRLLSFYIIGIFIISYSSCLFFSSNYTEATFFLTPTRIWELILGVIASQIDGDLDNLKLKYIYNNILSILGLFCIFYAAFFFNKNTSIPLMIVPTIGSVLIILFSKNNTLVKNILSQKLFVGLGLISYSAYLWHQPLFAFTRYKMHSDPSSTIMILLCIVSILLAIFTYIFIEKPIRRKDKFKTNFFLYFIGFFLIIISFGFFIRSTNGFEKFFISNNKFLFGPRMEFFDLVKKHTGKDPFKNMVNDGVCKFWSQDLSNEFETKFRNCSNYFGKAIIVLGDSHGMNAYNIVAKSNISPFVVGLAKPACRPYNTQSNCQYEKFTKFTQNNNSIIKTIIFHQSGSYLDELSIPATLNYLDNLNKYAKVLWLGPHTEARFKFKDISSYSKEPMISYNTVNFFGILERSIEKVVESTHSKIEYIKFSEIFFIGTRSLQIESCIIFRDDDHFSECGENLIAPFMKNSLIKLGF